MTTPTTNPPTERLTAEQLRTLRDTAQQALASNIVAQVISTSYNYHLFTEAWTPKVALALLADRDALAADLRNAEGWIADVEEREAACCPEDVGFDEYIRHLQAELQEAREQIARLRKHSEWQASYGDVHPGDKQFNAGEL